MKQIMTSEIISANAFHPRMSSIQMNNTGNFIFGVKQIPLLRKLDYLSQKDYHPIFRLSFKKRQLYYTVKKAT